LSGEVVVSTPFRGGWGRDAVGMGERDGASNGSTEGWRVPEGRASRT
jgi:hypothetical protein